MPALFYYDIETQIEDSIQVPNYLVCMASDGLVYFDFYGSDCIESFLEWLISDGAKTPRILVAHNAGRFDLYPILKVLYKWCLQPELLVRGQRILCLTLKKYKLKFIDSFNFIPIHFKQFSKMFNISTTKGTFPFLLNTAENQNYNSAFPEKKYFAIDTMTSQQRKEFDIWYENKAQKYIGKTYNLRRELSYYCLTDVDLLRMGCETFREDFLGKCNLDPFCRSYNIVIRMQQNVQNELPTRRYGYKHFSSWSTTKHDFKCSSKPLVTMVNAH